MSRIADDIVREYKIKQAYSKRKRQLCKEQECQECNYFNVCKEEGKIFEEDNSIS